MSDLFENHIDGSPTRRLIFQSPDGTYQRKKSNRSVSIGSAVIHINVDDDELEKAGQALAEPPLLYKVSDAPPIYLTILFGFQVHYLSYSQQSVSLKSFQSFQYWHQI